MDSQVCIDIDEPCGRGRHLIEGTSPEARAAVARQCEQDAGWEKIHNLVTEALAMADRQRSQYVEILALTEQRMR